MTESAVIEPVGTEPDEFQSDEIEPDKIEPVETDDTCSECRAN